MSTELMHPSRIVDSNKKKWVRLPRTEADVKIIAIDEVNNNILMMIKMAEGSSYPNHIHHCIAIAYTLEGSWEYEEGPLSPGVIAYEPDQSAHAPKVGPGGATVFVVLIGKDDHYIDFLRSDGSVGTAQTIEYFKTIEEVAETGKPFPADFGKPKKSAA